MSKSQDKLNKFLAGRQTKIDKLAEDNAKAKNQATAAMDEAYAKADAIFSDAIKVIEDEIIKLQNEVEEENQVKESDKS